MSNFIWFSKKSSYEALVKLCQDVQYVILKRSEMVPGLLDGNYASVLQKL